MMIQPQVYAGEGSYNRHVIGKAGWLDGRVNDVLFELAGRPSGSRPPHGGLPKARSQILADSKPQSFHFLSHLQNLT